MTYVGDHRTIDEQIRDDPSLVDDAREHVEAMAIPGTPGLRFARVLKAAGLPEWCGTKRVREISITKGDPMHGEMRSDDHIGRFEIELPFGEIGWHEIEGTNFDDSVGPGPDVCAECGCDRAVYRYRATHFIAGDESVYCPDCETVYASHSWG